MSSNQSKGIVHFFKEVRGEFSKIVWPIRAEFVGAVIVAIFVLIVFSVYLGAVDFCLGWLMKTVFSDVLGV